MRHIIKRIMFCHTARTLSYIVGLLHLIWSIRKLYFTLLDLIDYDDVDNQQLSEDGIFDMPIPAVRYLVLLFLLIVITSILLIIGLIMNRPLCISSFLLTMTIFILTFIVFGVWDVYASYVVGVPAGKIFLEFSNDSTLIVGVSLLLYPVFIVLTDITESTDQIDIQLNTIGRNLNYTRGYSV